MPSSAALRAIGADVLALLLAATCAGCEAPETLLCASCRLRIRAHPLTTSTTAGLLVRAAMPFESVPARCVRRLKDDGETRLAHPLGAALGEVLRSAVEGRSVDEVVVVPVPTSRAAFRRRGYRVPELLIRRAGYTHCRLLSARRPTVDQRGLDVEDRTRNVHGSMSARGGGGRTVVLVDDVMTTGATLDEAARALRVAGADVLSAVVLAATPRHSERNAYASETRRKRPVTSVVAPTSVGGHKATTVRPWPGGPGQGGSNGNEHRWRRGGNHRPLQNRCRREDRQDPDVRVTRAAIGREGHPPGVSQRPCTR